MRRGPRVNYDAIAHLYDNQPYRARPADAEFLALALVYQAGVNRLERDIADPSMARSRQDHLCLVTIRSEMPSGG